MDPSIWFLGDKYISDAMFSLFNIQYSSLNKQHCTSAIFCDFSKASYCVQYCGLKRTPLARFKSYFSKNSHLISVNMKMSSCKTIGCGVPKIFTIPFRKFLNSTYSFRQITAILNINRPSAIIKDVDFIKDP